MSYMQPTTIRSRLQPRIPVATLCTTVINEREQLACVVDISEGGLRIERPLRGRGDGRIVQLEFELPEVDEILWAQAEIRFDRMRAGAAGQPLRTSGVRIVAAASRHLRLMRDWVHAYAEPMWVG
jgi:hypothetical protein